MAAGEAVDVAYDTLPCVTVATAALQPDALPIWPECAGQFRLPVSQGRCRGCCRRGWRRRCMSWNATPSTTAWPQPLETRAIGFRATATPTGPGLTPTWPRRLRSAPATGQYHLQNPDGAHPRGGARCRRRLRDEELSLSRICAGASGRRENSAARWLSPNDRRISSHPRRAANCPKRPTLALDKNGRFLGLEVRAVANMGAYLSTLGPISSTNAAGSAIGGVYAIPAVFFEVRGAFTNTPPGSTPIAAPASPKPIT